MAPRRPVRLGLRENAAQFTLLVAVNALVGGMVGQQQTVLPLLAEQDFNLTGYAFIFAYIAAFGVTKAAANYLAGTLSDRFGRKPVLIAGWVFAIPVPLLIIWAPSWGWVVLANVLLGINQGLSWSTTVMMKIDLVGPRQRGLAMGLNEAAGYGAVAVTSLLAGWLAQQYGLRPAPFLLGLSYTVLALILSTFFIRETREHVTAEAATADAAEAHRSNGRIFADTTWREPALSSASQAGLVNNLNFGLSWGVFPLLFATGHLDVARIGLLVALYPAVWGAGQLATGWLSDHWGRKPFVDRRRPVPAVRGHRGGPHVRNPPTGQPHPPRGRCRDRHMTAPGAESPHRTAEPAQVPDRSTAVLATLIISVWRRTRGLVERVGTVGVKARSAAHVSSARCPGPIHSRGCSSRRTRRRGRARCWFP